EAWDSPPPPVNLFNVPVLPPAGVAIELRAVLNVVAAAVGVPRGRVRLRKGHRRSVGDAAGNGYLRVLRAIQDAMGVRRVGDGLVRSIDIDGRSDRIRHPKISAAGKGYQAGAGIARVGRD